MRQIDSDLQAKIGSKAEKNYFSVMHLGGVKVLWDRPEDYEHSCGVDVAESVKASWYERTGRERLQWVIHDQDHEGPEDTDCNNWAGDADM